MSDRPQYSLTIDEPMAELNLYEAMGSPQGEVDAVLTLTQAALWPRAGVQIRAEGFAPGSTVLVVVPGGWEPY